MLASTCNSTIMEIYGDMIRISHGFSQFDMLFFIALTCTLPLKYGNVNITNFQESLKRAILLQINRELYARHSGTPTFREASTISSSSAWFLYRLIFFNNFIEKSGFIFSAAFADALAIFSRPKKW